MKRTKIEPDIDRPVKRVQPAKIPVAKVKDEDLVNINVRRVPRSLRQAFKARCSARGTEMSAEIIDHMRWYCDVDDQEKG